MKNVVLRNQTRATVISDKVAVADSTWSRFLGLMGRKQLPAGEGLWIYPSSGVHTMWMRFAIDVIALDRNKCVIDLWPRMKPWRFSRVSTKIASVLEFPSGTIAAMGIEVGDQLETVAAQTVPGTAQNTTEFSPARIS